MFGKVVQLLAKPFVEVGTKVATDWSARKTAKLEGALELQRAQQELKVTKVRADIDSAKQAVQNDSDYDMQVLKNREKTYADEFIILVWFAVFLAHFVPPLQPYMAGGWEAMGYGEAPPFWFELGMVGILVSTLGLMRLLKIMIGKGFRIDKAS